MVEDVKMRVKYLYWFWAWKFKNQKNDHPYKYIIDVYKILKVKGVFKNSNQVNNKWNWSYMDNFGLGKGEGNGQSGSETVEKEVHDKIVNKRE